MNNNSTTIPNDVGGEIDITGLEGGDFLFTGDTSSGVCWALILTDGSAIIRWGDTTYTYTGVNNMAVMHELLTTASVGKAANFIKKDGSLVLRHA